MKKRIISGLLFVTTITMLSVNFQPTSKIAGIAGALTSGKMSKVLAVESYGLGVLAAYVGIACPPQGAAIAAGAA